MLSLQQRFGMRLKLLRVAKGFTQEQFAELADVSTALISSLERGINQPSFKNVERFALVLNVPEQELFDFRKIAKIQQERGVRVRAPRKRSVPIVRNKKPVRRPPK